MNPDLENRFLPPQNWEKSDFVNPQTKHQIHFQYGVPEQSCKGIIVLLPGLSEFGEKYYETANFFIKNGYGFYVMDWAYQGHSCRFKENSQKRYSDGYDSDISDLNYLIENHMDKTIPLFMLGHSMGGHIGLRFLCAYPKIFKAASFSTPMIDILDLKYIGWLVYILKPLFQFFQTSYVPGGQDWHEKSRKSDGTDIFSSDPIRDHIHNIWCLHDPALQVGNPTFKWVLESLTSAKILKENIAQITIPVLLAMAGQEKLVDNKSIKKASSMIENSKIIKLVHAKHELLMETDDIRDEFLNETLGLFKQST